MQDSSGTTWPSASGQHPPGTVLLDDVTAAHSRTILQPVPSSDPNDPLNWTRMRKNVNFGLACAYTFVVYVVIDIATVVYGQVKDELGFSFQELNQSFAVSNAGLGLGGVLFIPFALCFGRRPVYLASIAVMVGTTVWQARMQTLADLYGFNFVCGLAGSVGEIICAMTIADLFFVSQRGAKTYILTIALNTGTFLAPVAAGYIATALGWRWIWWWSVILSGVLLVIFIFFYEETIFNPSPYPTAGTDEPGTHDAEKAMLAEVDSRSPFRPPIRLDIPLRPYRARLALFTRTDSSPRSLFRHVYQPFIILATFPGVAFVALVFGSLLAWLAIALNVQATYFTMPPYNFSSSGVGLLNIPTLIGCLLGGLFGGHLSDYSIKWLARRNGGLYEPEMRLWLAFPAILIAPAGYFMFGFSIAKGMPWPVPAVGLGVYGFGSAALGNITLVYLVDSYRDVIGEAYIGVIFVRNAFGVVGAILTAYGADDDLGSPMQAMDGGSVYQDGWQTG
ncbi:Major facilitator superfamily transporter [Cordyceps militaris CM01]|uniref:Major facilitator superfamily transporter n=1 Tax=Cordyceps militaris (strain CM01) TaxID=983644 RepID=G3JCM3_CORMM|nr:Major facilitator superfamily transporter [Cordyceps militaris CM01]EGX93835.1 Major facilitator superfamily transporter [Cordyceps militaris CM01]